jgi:hypothetical protein
MLVTATGSFRGSERMMWALVAADLVALPLVVVARDRNRHLDSRRSLGRLRPGSLPISHPRLVLPGTDHLDDAADRPTPPPTPSRPRAVGLVVLTLCLDMAATLLVVKGVELAKAETPAA